MMGMTPMYSQTIIGVLYLSSVTFFALWRSEIDTQAMRAELAQIDKQRGV